MLALTCFSIRYLYVLYVCRDHSILRDSDDVFLLSKAHGASIKLLRTSCMSIVRVHVLVIEKNM